jgi:Spy/CpxP family protein refolding chaperone
MRIQTTLGALVLGRAVCAALPAADKEKADQPIAGGPAEQIQDLCLTDQQEAKIADGELKEMGAESLAEEIAHLGDLQLTDAEIFQITEIRKEFRPKIGSTLDELEGLLTDYQKKARQDALQSSKKRREVLEALNLSDETKEKLHTVCSKVGTLCREEMEKLRAVFSPDQKEKFQELKDETKENAQDRMGHQIATWKDLNLTEDQKSQIAGFRKAFRPKVQEAGEKRRATVREQVDAILAVLKSS